MYKISSSFILLTDAWLYWEQRYALDFMWFQLSLKLSAASNCSIVKIYLTHTVPGVFCALNAHTDFTFSNQWGEHRFFYLNRVYVLSWRSNNLVAILKFCLYRSCYYCTGWGLSSENLASWLRWNCTWTVAAALEMPLLFIRDRLNICQFLWWGLIQKLSG